MFKVLLVASSAFAPGYGPNSPDEKEVLSANAPDDSTKKYIKVAETKQCSDNDFDTTKFNGIAKIPYFFNSSNTGPNSTACRKSHDTVTNFTIDGKPAKNFMANNDPDTVLKVMEVLTTDFGLKNFIKYFFDVYVLHSGSDVWTIAAQNRSACEREREEVSIVEGSVNMNLPDICNKTGPGRVLFPPPFDLDTDFHILKAVPAAVGTIEVITVAWKYSDPSDCTNWKKGFMKFCTYMKLEPANQKQITSAGQRGAGSGNRIRSRSRTGNFNGTPPAGRRSNHKQNAGEDRIISPVQMVAQQKKY